MKGRRRTRRSAHRPETSLRTAAVASSRPSSHANAARGDPSTWVMNAGRSGSTISLATSVNKLTKPIATTLRLSHGAPANRSRADNDSGMPHAGHEGWRENHPSHPFRDHVALPAHESLG